MHLLFDLDGTLTDPFPGITRCIEHALVSLGRPCPSAESLGWCIGPPLKRLILQGLQTIVREILHRDAPGAPDGESGGMGAVALASLEKT